MIKGGLVLQSHTTPRPHFVARRYHPFPPKSKRPPGRAPPGRASGSYGAPSIVPPVGQELCLPRFHFCFQQMMSLGTMSFVRLSTYPRQVETTLSEAATRSANTFGVINCAFFGFKSLSVTPRATPQRPQM